ncbi:PRD domain-containing protein [Caminicella sporogenes]|uniref:PRD domain-containing protein n=1 Tax=Caminicella sporogenes TaxID=166485 RepID=UPI0025417830|nr:PRD domain-containing protein [Caminicella sporogenes]WIF93973.1 PRD domain-containing protein [Caminicella sporogenes]
MEKYTIKKILSNNVVLVERNKQNLILVGKGIGFGKKKGYVIENSEIIEEKFISLKGLNEDEYENFLETVDPKIIEISKNIIEMVEEELGEELNPNIYLGFIDHINFAIKRLEEGIEIVNPFLFETKILYPVEYRLAEKAVEILKKDLNIDIPKAEVGFLTLHIYGGRANRSKKEALENSILINKVLEVVEKKIKIKIDKESFICRRFIMHLIGVIDRVLNDKCHRNNLVPKIKDELRYEFSIAYDISKIMEKILKKSVPESEIGYIALHLHKINNLREEIIEN